MFQYRVNIHASHLDLLRSLPRVHLILLNCGLVESVALCVWSEFIIGVFLPIFIYFTLDPLNALPNNYTMIIYILFIKIQSWYLDCARVLVILDLDYFSRI